MTSAPPVAVPPRQSSLLTRTPTSLRSTAHKSQLPIHLRLQNSRLITLWKLSVWHRVQLPVLLASVWATFVWSMHWVGFQGFGGGAAGSLVGILSMVTGLFVSFRSGSSYDRWYEGRRIWASIQSTSRTTLRLLIFSLPPSTAPYSISPHSEAIHELCQIVCAFSVACTRHLRDEFGVSQYPELASLLPPALIAAYPPNGSPPRNLPLLLIRTMHAYLNELKNADAIDGNTWSGCQSGLNAFTDQLTSLERVRDTPIPVILQVHLQLLLLVYIAAVPLQLVRPLGVWSIPATAISSLVFYGVDRAGEELSDPFGTEPNDLPLAKFSADIHAEYLDLAGIPVPSIDGNVAGTSGVTELGSGLGSEKRRESMSLGGAAGKKVE
ncbi:hypothetical protein T439DRAFT_199296 [Meredithblackwellia eburnea MCA 4105]